MTPDEVLDRAADLYDTGARRWGQYAFVGDAGEVCMSYAMYLAAGRPLDYQSEENLAFTQARAFTGRQIGSIPKWNDQRGRTKEEVINKLHELAKQYREETQV